MSVESIAVQIAAAAVPAVIALISALIGSKQVREFHRRTGDDSVLSHIAAFSSFSDDRPKAEVCAPEKVRTHA